MDEFPPRVLALDPGQRRIGVAVSDPFGTIALGLETLSVNPKNPVGWYQELLKLVKHYQAQTLVIGYPKNMDGSIGPKAEQSEQLADNLEAFFQTKNLAVEIHLYDERLTSVIAHNSLQAMGVKASRNKGLVDQAAARELLQNYLDQTRAPQQPI